MAARTFRWPFTLRGKQFGSFVACALLASLAFATADFETYRVIIERKPFGEEPKPLEKAGPVPPSQSFVAELNLRLSTIVETPSGPKVGIQNAKAQRNYWMGIGDIEDGIELVDVDYDAQWAKVRKDGDEQTLHLGAGIAAAPLVAGAALAARFANPVPFTPTNMLSYAAARMMRRTQLEDERRKRIEGAKQELTGEALDKYLREYQLNLIRAKGELGPPMPIPLTPEEDSQLVKEGVLPPQ